MDSNPFLNDLVEAWQTAHQYILDDKKTLTHKLNKQKSFVDADKKSIVENEDRLFNMTNFLELTKELVEA